MRYSYSHEHFKIIFLFTVIIIAANKCQDAPGSDWWLNQRCYHVWTSRFKDSNKDTLGDFDGLSRQLPELIKMLNINVLWPSHVVQMMPNRDNGVLDYLRVDSAFGGLTAFKKMIETAHKNSELEIFCLYLTLTAVFYKIK